MKGALYQTEMDGMSSLDNSFIPVTATSGVSHGGSSSSPTTSSANYPYVMSSSSSSTSSPPSTFSSGQHQPHQQATSSLSSHLSVMPTPASFVIQQQQGRVVVRQQSNEEESLVTYYHHSLQQPQQSVDSQTFFHHPLPPPLTHYRRDETTSGTNYDNPPRGHDTNNHGHDSNQPVEKTFDQPSAPGDEEEEISVDNPPVQRNGDEEGNPSAKPPYSYVALITMALKDSSTGELPLREIYAYIMRRFPYYTKESKGWQNSIRHNLSLNECFVKKTPDPLHPDKTKGNKWSLHPLYENMFEGNNYRRRKKIRKPKPPFLSTLDHHRPHHPHQGLFQHHQASAFSSYGNSVTNCCANHPCAIQRPLPPRPNPPPPPTLAKGKFLPYIPTIKHHRGHGGDGSYTSNFTTGVHHRQSEDPWLSGGDVNTPNPSGGQYFYDRSSMASIYQAYLGPQLLPPPPSATTASTEGESEAILTADYSLPGEPTLSPPHSASSSSSRYTY